MPGSDSIEVIGTVIEALPQSVYRVELPNGHRLIAHASGGMRLDFTKVQPGDRVVLEMSPYDLSKGRIVRSEKNEEK